MGYMDDLYLASYTLKRVRDILPVDVVEEYWKGNGDLHSVVDEVYDTSSRLPGSKVGRYWCMWGWSEVEWVDMGGCGPTGGKWDNQDGKAAA